MPMMKAARVYKPDHRIQIDEVMIPEPTGRDVMVEVKASGVVPNLKNVLLHLEEWFPMLPLPASPAIYGLDPAGLVSSVGNDATGVRKGQRVYVNPVRVCGTCEQCRRGNTVRCPAYTFAGYFGFSPLSVSLQERYPYGGFAQYLIAPADSLVYLPDNLSFELASRFGYLGTSYAALRKGLNAHTQTLLINGATGTLGVGLVLLALALGIPKIYAVARNHELLERVRQLNPKRIEVFSTQDGSTKEWAMDKTSGIGVDLVVDALAAGAPLEASVEALYSVGRGGQIVTIGGQRDNVPVNPIWLLANEVSYHGSSWFTTAQGQDIANMIETGVLDLSALENHVFALHQLSQAIESAEHRPHGGFDNIVVRP